MMSKRGDVIEYSYPYVPAGSVIAFGVKLSIYDNMNQNPDKNDIKIFGAYELTRDFLVLHVDKSIFEKKTIISSKLRNLAMSANEDGEDDDVDPDRDTDDEDEMNAQEEALQIENTKVLIFGKPTSKKGRRMGVVLSSNDDINIARENADKSALKIKVIS